MGVGWRGLRRWLGWLAAAGAGGGALAVLGGGAVFLLPALRRGVVTAGIFKARALPSMSQTERTLEAGTVVGGRALWRAA